MKNVGSKITKQIDILNTNNEGFIDYKVNKYLKRRSDVQFEEMLDQIQGKMPCIHIVRFLIRKNK
jgi:hypothetical protein